MEAFTFHTELSQKEFHVPVCIKNMMCRAGIGQKI